MKYVWIAGAIWLASMVFNVKDMDMDFEYEEPESEYNTRIYDEGRELYSRGRSSGGGRGRSGSSGRFNGGGRGGSSGGGRGGSSGRY